MKKTPSNNLRILRTDAGLTGQQLEEMTGIAKGEISKFETGKRQLMHEHIIVFCRAFNCSPARLLGCGTNENEELESKKLDKDLVVYVIETGLTFLGTLPRTMQKNVTPSYVSRFCMLLYEIAEEQKQQQQQMFIGNATMKMVMDRVLH